MLGKGKKLISDRKPVYVIDGMRTPFLKASGGPGPFSAADLATQAGRALLARQGVAPDQLDEVVVGAVMPRETEANIGRLVALRLGCPDSTVAYTVQRNCASGMQALDSALKDLQLGRSDLVLCGGAEAMSHAPLICNPSMVSWLMRLQQKGLWAQCRAFLGFRLRYLKPIIALMKGLQDPLSGMIMGQTAELLAYRFGISRLDMDTFTYHSHQRAFAAQEQGFFQDELTPVWAMDGRVFDYDTGVRPDSTIEKLGTLRPFFDRPYGLVTAANSSQVTDGSCMLLLASEEAVKAHGLPVLGRIVDVEWAALDPDVMGLGPVYASTPILQRHDLSLSDIDCWEINEAFSAQVLACLRAWEDDSFCQKELGLPSALGTLNVEQLNVDGGGVSLGHPVGASGARIVLHALNVLKRTGQKRAMATICIGGGQGGALLLERGE